LLNHRRLRAAERRPLRQTVVAEALIGLTVFGLAAVITSSQPALEPQFIQAKASSAVPLIDAPAADLQQTLSIRPNLPGRNLIVVDVFNTRRPPPGPIIGVDIALRSSSTKPGPSVAAQPLGDGHWTVPVEIAVGGKTAVQVTVRRLRLPDVTSRFSWTVKEPVIARRAALVSNASISQPLQLAGLILMALVAFGWLAWLGWPHTARGKALRQAGRTPPGALKAGSPAPTSAMGGELELAELIHTGAD
jgi:copper transport protein